MGGLHALVGILHGHVPAGEGHHLAAMLHVEVVQDRLLRFVTALDGGKRAKGSMLGGFEGKNLTVSRHSKGKG
jgi:hypothetical protein